MYRLKIPEFGPLFLFKCRIVDKFRSWLLIAQGNLPCNIAFQAQLSGRMVRKNINEIQHVFSIPRGPSAMKKYVTVDETYKQAPAPSGQTSSKAEFLVHEGYQVDPNTGKSIQTYWKATIQRTKEVCHDFVRSVINGRNAMVVTDEWRPYREMGEFCRHYSVCHADQFVREHSPPVKIYFMCCD